MNESKVELIRAIKHLIPFYAGIFSFGLVFSTLALSSGIVFANALFMSVIMYSGSSQIVAVQLMSQQSSVLFVIIGAFIVGSRFFVYMLSLSDILLKMSPITRIITGTLMVDQVYFLVLNRQHYGGTQENKDAYVRWMCLISYFWWLLAVLTGLYFGTQLISILPHSQINFLSIMAFVIIICPCLREHYNVIAIVSSCLFYSFAQTLGYSYSVAMMLSASCGVFFTMIVRVVTNRLK